MAPQNEPEFKELAAYVGLFATVVWRIPESEPHHPAHHMALDAICRSKGVITLSEVRRRYWTKYKAILKRERIRNQTEYYLAVGLVNDLTAELSPAERQNLQDLVSGFEASIARQFTKPGGPAGGGSAG